MNHIHLRKCALFVDGLEDLDIDKRRDLLSHNFFISIITIDILFT